LKGEIKMNSKKIKRVIIFFTSFILAALIIIGSGYYKQSLSKETSTIHFNLKDEKIKPITYDIADEGTPKRIAQPGKITVSTGHGAGIINNTEKPISVQVKAKDFEHDIDIDSSDTSFDKESGTFIKPIEAGNGLNLSITFEIPRKNIENSSISSGEIVFTNIDNGELINELPIKIINSNAK
jgi:hypothetical protein